MADLNQKPEKSPVPVQPYRVDRFIRHPAEEHRLNEAFFLVFDTDPGRLVLEYLATMTLRQVCEPGSAAQPGASTEQLWHLEGQRYLFALIQLRLNEGRNKRPHLGEANGGTNRAN